MVWKQPAEFVPPRTPINPQRFAHLEPVEYIVPKQQSWWSRRWLRSASTSPPTPIIQDEHHHPDTAIHAEFVEQSHAENETMMEKKTWGRACLGRGGQPVGIFGSFLLLSVGCLVYGIIMYVVFCHFLLCTWCRAPWVYHLSYGWIGILVVALETIVVSITIVYVSQSNPGVCYFMLCY